MAITEQAVFGDLAKGIITVTPPGASKPSYLGSPAVGTWIELVQGLQACEGKTPDASFVTKCVAACLVNEEGHPIDDGSLRAVLAKAPPAPVLWLYKKCWNTVLKVDVQTIGDIEKN